MIFYLLIIECLLFGTYGYDWLAYEGFKLLDVTPESEEQVKYLKELQHTLNLDFWLDPSGVGINASIFVGPHQLESLEDQLQANNLQTLAHNYDITGHLKDEWSRVSKKPMAYDYEDFNEYASFMEEIRNLANNFCPADLECSVSTIGQSIEGRNIDMLTIKNGNPSAQSIWMDSNIHAREWLSSATMMNIMKRMLTIYDPSDPGNAGTMLLAYNWYYVPIVNPDGHQYTWTVDRLWRKNRRDHVNSSCFGTDLNRNFDFNWGQPGAGITECSETFRGASVASEPETQAIQNQVLALQNELIAFWTVHTYGQYLLAPYGNCTLPPDWSDISYVLDETCASISAAYGTTWQCDNGCSILGQASGTTSDWAYDKAGIKYAMTPELRGQNGGFVPPPSEIALSVNEIWEGISAMIVAIQDIEGSRG